MRRTNQGWFVVLAAMTAPVLFNAGCSGAGGVAVQTSNAVSGQVQAPAGLLVQRVAGESQPGEDTIRAQIALSAVPGAVVTMGTLDNTGLIFTPLAGASAVSDALGRFSIDLPAAQLVSPNLQLRVGAGPTLMTTLAFANQVDLNPAAAAATNLLLAQARASGVPLQNLLLFDLQNYYIAAVQASFASSGNNVAEAIANTSLVLLNSGSVTAALQTAITHGGG